MACHRSACHHVSTSALSTPITRPQAHSKQWTPPTGPPPSAGDHHSRSRHSPHVPSCPVTLPLRRAPPWRHHRPSCTTAFGLVQQRWVALSVLSRLRRRCRRRRSHHRAAAAAARTRSWTCSLSCVLTSWGALVLAAAPRAPSTGATTGRLGLSACSDRRRPSKSASACSSRPLSTSTGAYAHSCTVQETARWAGRRLFRHVSDSLSFSFGSRTAGRSLWRARWPTWLSQPSVRSCERCSQLSSKGCRLFAFPCCWRHSGRAPRTLSPGWSAALLVSSA